MFRILVFLFMIGLATVGLGLLVEQPGSLSLTWFGYHIDTSPLVGLGVVALVAIVAWGLIRFVFNLPSLVSVAARARKRARGHEAIARGIIAAGVGDVHKARKASRDAKKLAPHEPLALLLEAQAAQLSGDREGAERAFRAMTERSETKLLGLRGLHAESLRRGDQERAHEIALEAQNITPLSWSGQALLDRYTTQNDWDAARLAVAQNLKAKIIDSETANRQRAVIDTALAMEAEMTDPDRAIGLLRAAVRKAPDLVPATALLARLLARRGNLRSASKLIEAAYAKTPHPDLAQAYVDMRSGDSAADRLARAKTLAKFAPKDPESAMMVATAALGARDFAAAREAMTPLVAMGERPTSRMCVIMAELEEREHNAQGLVREWLARGSRATRDAVWIADGHWSKQWAPVSPVTGKLDAYRWMQPKEELAGPVEEPPPAYAPPPPPPALEVEAPRAELAPPPEEPAAPEPALPAPEEKIEDPAQQPPLQEAPAQEPPARQPSAKEAPAKYPPRQPSAPEPVIFPLATPPDDPGPKKQEAETRLF
ncbi:heme biosynthesis protein HemY [Rhodoblastus acidophilus]|uniref:Heme biosynthesis protein HemY n=1 Tax=Candidatus Rhodoblastus alkanivorans TaxID=2954117 RepID=A0ABS9Z1R0_9HYPH|nr:heme biosynthesis HemY N-terminal domain-containing protein [Candidatus Rhodoblastus alkanivorans]MCI4678085.1 heme biosynthesis protein HemY [Candidatus Rhodoblastus alkanivorans]MCI4681574.1 heme biosynthesis protein HemY [Candidatus Rhodoblastus alkanivorans]MDI4642622.1 heme biosynthesis protein HemY [Rhodoblastus acidophilus]